MAAKQLSTNQLLELGDENASTDATAKCEEIKEVGKLARRLGDLLFSITEVKRRQNERERSNRTSWLSQFKEAIDVTLVWLEHKGQNMKVDAKKREQILRGLYNLTKIGVNARIFVIMEIVSAFLTSDQDPFPGERQYIVQCLEDVKDHQKSIESLVADASRLLKKMLGSESVDFLNGMQFDNIVREAKTKIDLCSRRLNGAEKAIYELAGKMITIKWSWRGMLGAGLAFTTYFLFKRYQESSHSLLDLLQFGGLTLVAFIRCFRQFLDTESVFYEFIAKLESQHCLLKEKLENLRISLTSAKDFRDGLLKSVVFSSKI
ncbi:uncharacterized protein LOC124434264 isoform X1 [Xenia sp. Carnegie-2017]|uniref:uncharacterized protein LOC124434264 isoform X1 n=1 Tax=Xenia sp. Carnegie-2017 TaxID=2897299 RepID=UPI001F039C4E|nr:uncharacterized protein LOC124434264 isoform X1 [Xenia sp. Carnegie-2017]